MMAASSFSVALLAACLFVMQAAEVDAVPAGRELLNDKPSCAHFDCPVLWKADKCQKKKGVCHPNNYCSGEKYGYCKKNCGRRGVSCFYAYKKDVVCRRAWGACDLPEKCTGMSASCPNDGPRKDEKTVCKKATKPCENDATCDGKSRYCPDTTAKYKGLCQKATKPCENDAYCDGKSKDCPDTTAKDDTKFVCKAATKKCEDDATCDGKSKYCPDTKPKESGKTMCSDPLGPCDEGEYCDGKSKDCPDAVYTCLAKGGASPDKFKCEDKKHYLF